MNRTIGEPFCPHKSGRILLVPLELARVAELSPGAKLVYSTLRFHAWKKAECWPSLGTIGREVGLSSRQVQRHLRELISHRLVRSEPRFTAGRRSTNRYELLWHEWLAGEASTKEPDEKPTVRAVERHWVAELSTYFPGAHHNWTGKEYGQARFLLGRYRDALPLVRKAITYAMRNWGDLSRRLELTSQTPTIGLLVSEYGNVIFTEAQGYRFGENLKTGLKRGEFDPKSAARSPKIGWADRKPTTPTPPPGGQEAA